MGLTASTPAHKPPSHRLTNRRVAELPPQPVPGEPAPPSYNEAVGRGHTGDGTGCKAVSQNQPGCSCCTLHRDGGPSSTPCVPPRLLEVPEDILFGIVDRLPVEAACALRLTCTAMNTSLATDLRRKHFRQISIMGTRAGVSALRAIASNRFVSRHVVEVRINTAIVGDMTSANPTFHDQLALLELDALDTGIKVKKVGPRVYPVAPNPRPSQPLALLLGEALARLPNLARVSTHYWNPRPVGENATAPPSSSVGLCALRGKGGFICGGQGNRPYAAALFWGIVLALAHAHTPRTKMGYPPIRALQCRSGGVTLASFPKAMVHQALLAPALAGLEGLNVMVLPGTDPAAERVAFTAFLNLASNLRELSLHGMWTTSHTGVLGCLAGPKAAVLPCLERLELFTHETTTEVMFRLLSTTRVPWVRLSQVHLRWVTGEGNVRFPSYGERESAWSSLLTAVSEYHKAAGTTSAVKTLELNDVHQWRNGQFERVPFHRGRSKKHHRAHHCFIIGTGDRTNFGRVRRLDEGEDIFRCASEELRGVGG